MNWNNMGGAPPPFPFLPPHGYPPRPMGGGFGWPPPSHLPTLPGMSNPMYPPLHAPPFPPPRPFPQNYGPYSHNNPLNPMLVYQTNNYYGSNYQNEPGMLSHFQDFEQKPREKPHQSFHTVEKPAKPSDGKNQFSKKVPEIIQLIESQQQPVQQHDVKVHQKPKKEKITVKKKETKTPMKTQAKRKFEEEKVQKIQKKQRIDPLAQLERNLKKAAPEEQLLSQAELRRSKRQHIKKPQRLRQYLEEELAVPVQLRGKKLFFGFHMSEQQKVQLCLSKLREISPQIIISDKNQAKLPQMILTKDWYKIKIQKMQHLKSRIIT